jgi:hypothetical protein
VSLRQFVEILTTLLSSDMEGFCWTLIRKNALHEWLRALFEHSSYVPTVTEKPEDEIERTHTDTYTHTRKYHSDKVFGGCAYSYLQTLLNARV